MSTMLSNFPTEKVILHKPSGETYEVVALVGSSSINSDNGSIPIEIDDYFERNLPNGVIEYYQVIDPGFHMGMHDIPDHYQTKVKRINAPLDYKIDSGERKKIIFISHSSRDKEYAKAFVQFLFNIGLNEDDIVCSSYPGVGIPLREKVYDWLAERFNEYDLHVVFLLSHNYYQSPASLNEMGAAWVMKKKWDGILLPGFSLSDILGCIDSSHIVMILDGDLDELKHRLFELKDDVINEFGLRDVSSTRWERVRDSFISEISVIRPEENIL